METIVKETRFDMTIGRARKTGLALTAVLAMLAGLVLTPATGAHAAGNWAQGLTTAQIRSSYGFFKWMSVTSDNADQRADARRAMNQMNANAKEYGYIKLGDPDDATSLSNTRRALQEDIRSNQFRTSLRDEPCRMDLPAGKGRRCNDPNKRLPAQKLNLQMLGREQFNANAVYATKDHWDITDAQNIAGVGKDFRDWYDDQGKSGNEKANYDQDMTDGRLDGRAADGSSVGETGHYLNYVSANKDADGNDADYIYASIGVGQKGWAYVQNYWFEGSGSFINAYMPGYPDSDWITNGYVSETYDVPTNQAVTLPESLLARFDQYTSLPEVQAATSHTIRFDSAGGTSVAGQKVADGARATRPADPTRGGYSFAGWYLGDTRYDFSRPVTGDLTLTARWTRNAPQTVYRTIRFDSAGGTGVASQRVANGAKAKRPANPTRSGYSFAGWYLGDTKWDFNRTVTSDLTLTARWTRNQPSKPSDKPTPTVRRVPVYRVYNRNSGLHHYTTSKAESDMLVRLGWRDENHGKSSFVTVSRDTPGARPVYREYNRRSGNHNWTLNKAEHDMLVRLGWKNEGIAWYTSPTGANVYRLYNPKPYHKPRHGRGNGGGEHVYTTSYGEYLSVIRAGWRGEGVAWKTL